MNTLLQETITLTHAAADQIMRFYQSSFSVADKTPDNPVTDADLAADKLLRPGLGKLLPEAGWLSEETADSPERLTKSQCWVVDPLDGTMNFLHGIPHFATSIALEQHGEIVAGVTYSPVADELYWAERGVGAYLNDRRLRVSSRSVMADALIGTGIPHGHGDDFDRYHGEVRHIMPKVASLRRFGSSTLDLAYVAAGRLDGFWERGLGPWDLAAGILLIREAGGFATDVNGGGSALATGGIVAANADLHRELLSLLKRAGAD